MSQLNNQPSTSRQVLTAKRSPMRGFIAFQKGGVLLPNTGLLPRKSSDLETMFMTPRRVNPPKIGGMFNNFKENPSNVFRFGAINTPGPWDTSVDKPVIPNLSNDSFGFSSPNLDSISLGGALTAQQAFSNKSQSNFDQGTVASRISAENLSRQGNSVSTGILAGSAIGGGLGSVFGPIGSMVGTMLGSTLGGIVGSSTSTQRTIATTSGNENPTNSNLAY